MARPALPGPPPQAGPVGEDAAGRAAYEAAVAAGDISPAGAARALAGLAGQPRLGRGGPVPPGYAVAQVWGRGKNIYSLSLYIAYISTIHSLHINYIFPIYQLHIPCMSTIYQLYVNVFPPAARRASPWRRWERGYLRRWERRRGGQWIEVCPN